MPPDLDAGLLDDLAVLQVATRRQGTTAVIELEGEWDLGGAPAVRDAVPKTLPLIHPPANPQAATAPGRRSAGSGAPWPPPTPPLPLPHGRGGGPTTERPPHQQHRRLPPPAAALRQPARRRPWGRQ